MSPRLSGVTWDHARAHPPLERAGREFAALTGNATSWEARSLYEFGMQPLGDIAREHDLLIIDHPHVGEAADAEDLWPLDDLLDPADLALLASQSVGESHRSYEHDGRQWALALDAAAQVGVWRPDLLERPPKTWSAAVALAEEGKVLFPAAPTDAFASFLSLAANRGTPCATLRQTLIDRADGLAVLDDLTALVKNIDPICLELTPIDVLERLSAASSHEAYCPLLFGYTNYAREGFRPRSLKFSGIAGAVPGATGGSLLGGAGIAVSAHTEYPREAAAFAVFVCGAATQRGSYFLAGGQPANRLVWDDPVSDDLAGGFFSGTRETMEQAWVRPRHPGWLAVQDAGMGAIHAFLRGRIAADDALEQLDTTWRANPLCGPAA